MMKDMLVWQYFERWVANYKVGNVRKVTLAKYYQTLNSLKAIAPTLKIEELNRITYQGIIDEYGLTHEKVTTMDFHHHLKACVDDMIEDGLLDRNPTKKIVMKGKEPREKKIKYLSQFETQCLIREMDLQDEINCDYLILLIIKTGLRFSEALGLTTRDFDFVTQSITVNKTWNYKDGSAGGEFAPTKNASSARVVQLDWLTLQKFADLIKNIPPDTPIFLHGRKAGNLCNSTVNDFLTKKCKAAGVPCISVHGLRHTHASLLLANGVSIASVAKRLGHSNMATTQKVYLHIIKELENKDNALAIAAMMNLG